MDIYLGSADDDFLVRRGAIHAPTEPLPYPSMGYHPRVVKPLIDEELDNLVREAFDCNDAEDTFRGRLRQGVEYVKPDVLTSLCAYRIGFEFNATELSLLVTVLSGLLTQHESVEVLLALASVLESYDKRFADLAIEVAEQTILLVGRGQVMFKTSHGKKPAKGAKAMSRFGSYRLPGSNVGFADAHLGDGALGVFFPGVTASMRHCCFGLACNHVLSFSEMLTEPGHSMLDVVSLADSDSTINWGLDADNIIKLRNTAFAQTQEGQAQRLRWATSQPNTIVGTLYVSSGLRASPDHQVLDWALVKLDPTQIVFQLLRGVSPDMSTAYFQ